jgi:hypothetical protein
MFTSDDNDWTPYPGEQILPEEARPIIAAFERRFRVCTEGTHPRTPTWNTFDSSDSRLADRSAFSAFGAKAPVFLHFGGDKLRRTTAEEVCRYLEAQQPWEDWDLYVFDDSMNWCVALTHPQMDNQRLVIVAGTVPQRNRAP